MVHPDSRQRSRQSDRHSLSALRKCIRPLSNRIPSGWRKGHQQIEKMDKSLLSSHMKKIENKMHMLR